MNLGSIQDKTDHKFNKRDTVKKLVVSATLCCLAVAAVATAVSLGKKEPAASVAGRETASPFVVATARPATDVSGSGKIVPSATSTPAPIIESKEVAIDTANVKNMVLPVMGSSVCKGYASDNLLYSQTLKQWETHTGLDLAAESGKEVLAALDGTVSKISDDPMMGKTVVLTHEDGFETVYACLGDVSAELKEGATVLQGQLLGAVGNSASAEIQDGAHLHFEVRCNGKPVNPQAYLSTLK